MSLFDQLGGTAQPQRFNPRQALQQLQQDPVATLRSAHYSIPTGMTNPQQIINHLLQTGQLTNPRLQILGQLASNIFRR